FFLDHDACPLYLPSFPTRRSSDLNNESAGKHRSGRTRHGSKWLRKALIEAGQAAGRSKNTYLSAQYAQIRARRGPQRAAVAVGQDRKSTRLNSSHVKISYAVFCLK